MSVGDFVTWFKMNYLTTPAYHVDFTSPHDGQSIEWYYSTKARIARANGTLPSYVNYAIRDKTRTSPRLPWSTFRSPNPITTASTTV